MPEEYRKQNQIKAPAIAWSKKKPAIPDKISKKAFLRFSFLGNKILSIPDGIKYKVATRQIIERIIIIIRSNLGAATIEGAALIIKHLNYPPNPFSTVQYCHYNETK